MSLKFYALQNPSPRIACEYDVKAHPLYHKCDICPDLANCKLGQSGAVKPLDENEPLYCPTVHVKLNDYICKNCVIKNCERHKLVTRN